MDKPTKVSVITTAYIDTQDKLVWANEMIQSVINQSKHEWELIIYDDHSPIRLWNVYDDPRIKIIRGLERVGVSIGRNTAAYNASSEILFPLDADDILYPTALELLYNNWVHNRFVYGNVDILSKVGGQWQMTGTVRFPDFDCHLILNPKGIVPVSAMHAKGAWQIAGGWDNTLDHGLEDIEYWISMVRTSCTLGKNIHASIIQYRRHNTSRTQNMKNSGEEARMRDAIKLIHADLYGGQVDMGCGCGGSAKPQAGAQTVTSKQIAAASSGMMPETSPNDYKLVQYVGPRTGSFGVVGDKTKFSYKIKGHGYSLPVHNDDVQRFTLMGRRRDGTGDFVVIGNYSDQLPTTEIPETTPEPTPFKPNPAVFLDKISIVADGPEVEEVIVDQIKQDNLAQLPAKPSVKDQLYNDHWTYERLAEADLADLMQYKGVGEKTARRIIRFAMGKIKN